MRPASLLIAGAPRCFGMCEKYQVPALPGTGYGTLIVLAYIAGKVDITAIWRGTPRVFTLNNNRHIYHGFWLIMANLYYAVSTIIGITLKKH